VKDDAASALAFLSANGFKNAAKELSKAEHWEKWAAHWHEEAEKYSLRYCDWVARDTRAREALRKVGSLYRQVLLEVRQRRLEDMLCPLCAEGLDWDTTKGCRVCQFCAWSEVHD
jgi:hypothetical protein